MKGIAIYGIIWLLLIVAYFMLLFHWGEFHTQMSQQDIKFQIGIRIFPNFMMLMSIIGIMLFHKR